MAELPKSVRWRGQTLTRLPPVTGIMTEYKGDGFFEGLPLSVYTIDPDPGHEREWHGSVGLSGSVSGPSWPEALEAAFEAHKAATTVLEAHLESVRRIAAILEG